MARNRDEAHACDRIVQCISDHRLEGPITALQMDLEGFVRGGQDNPTAVGPHTSANMPYGLRWKESFKNDPFWFLILGPRLHLDLALIDFASFAGHTS